MADYPRLPSLRSRLLVLLVLGLTGLAVSIVVYRALLLRERALVQSQFRFDAQQRVAVIQRSLTVNEHVVQALSAFYGASQVVESDEFQTFTRPLLAQNPGIQQLGWAPRVADQDRVDYERRTAEDNRPGFQVMQRDNQGRLCPADRHEEYFPVEFLQSRDGGALSVGFDLRSDPAFREVIERVRQSGQASATACLRLGPADAAPRGFVAMDPVYLKGVPHDTPQQRRQNLEGIVLGVYQVAAVVETALRHDEALGINIYLFDDSAADGDDPLYVHHSHLQGEPAAEELPSRAEAGQGMHLAMLLDLPGRRWWVYCRPTPAYQGRRASSLPDFALVASLLVTALLLMFVNSLLGQNARVRRLVDRQTAELWRAQNDLNRGEAERVQAEAVLHDSEALYSSLVENLPVHVLRKDLQGRFTFANRLFCDLLHRPVQEIIGKTDLDLYPAALAEKFRRDDRQVMETGQMLEMVEENVADGQRRYVEVMKFPVRDAAGNIVGVQAIFWDVTLRKQAEAALERERYLLDTLMNNLPHNIYFKDLQSRFMRVNRAMAGYIGLQDASQALGKTDLDFFTEEHARQALQDEQEIIRTGRPILDKEEKETWPDGRCTWVTSTKLPLFDEQGQIAGTFGISRDVTEQRQAAEALRIAKEAAETANRAKSDFLANMSHEIRTPLNAIIGMTELMLDMPLDPSQREYLVMVRDSGESLLLVINDILDFSRIEAGRLELESIPFDLREHLGDTLKSLAVRAHRQELELACHVCPDVPDRLAGDPGRLRQVVVNLVGNAVKFTDRGEVVLDVACESRSQQEVVLHFTVTDTGIGIPEDKLGVIFEMFEQVDTSSRRKYGGTGLGLAICSRLVQRMGGRIWAESRIGQGSRFHFTARFALADGHPPTVAPREAEVIRGARVLVVDDNATNCRILEEMLLGWQMQPACAGGAAQAVQMLRQAQAAGEPFPLILTDSNMPDMDGFQLAEVVKQDPRLGSTVIMMLTSGDRPGDVARCEQLGIAAYMMKPIKQCELLEAVLLVLGAGEAEAESEQEPAAGQAAPLRPLRILLAEDSLVNQKLAVGLLERQGHSVTLARNGQEAIAAWELQPFDLVLMDLQMPDMDGLEATAFIRNREKRTGAHVPIIAMTAYAMTGDRERCLEAGMDDYVSKPIRARSLFETIASVLEGTAATGPERQPASPPAPIVDWDQALASVQGDLPLLRSIVEAALEELPGLMTAVAQAVARRDPAALRIAAHTLKGSLRYFGANAVFDGAYALEQMASSGDLGGAAEILSTLEREAARLTPQLENYLKVPGHRGT